MPKVRCRCGKKHQFPKSYVGKRLRCPNCGVIFSLVRADGQGAYRLVVEPAEPSAEVEAPLYAADRDDERAHRDIFQTDLEPVDDGIYRIADAPAAFSGDELDTAVARSTVPRQGEVDVPPGSPARATPGMDVGSATASVAPSESAGDRGYAANVLWTFLFPASPANLVVLLAIWLILAFSPLVGCIPILGFIVLLGVNGWYAGYRFEVIASAAAGESDLPELQLSVDAFVDYLGSLLKWLGSWIVVFLPAFACLAIGVQQGTVGGFEALAMLMGGLPGILQGPATPPPVYHTLVYVGLFLWPMVVLCVALGGFGALYRLDLIVRTIIITLPAYVLTLILMFAAIFGQLFLLGLLGGGIAAGAQPSLTSLAGRTILIYILAVGVGVYLSIVLMRLIGLYYYHFKHRFAWDWE